MTVRVIPRLDIKGPNLVKGIHFEGLRVLGKPEDFARHYYETGADELFYMDAVASLYGRNSLLEIESLAGSFVVDRRHSELACTELCSPNGPLEGIDARRLPAVVDVGFVFAIRLPDRLDGDDDRRRAEGARGTSHELGIADRGRIDRHLVGARTQDVLDVLDAP